jgi:hypothetical protein
MLILGMEDKETLNQMNNPINNPIVVKCKANALLPMEKLLSFQGSLKKLSPKNRDKLKESILRNGFIAPFFIWDDNGEYNLLDGHQRLLTLKHLQKQGWVIPELPVAFVEADNEQDAKLKLLHITSSYGEFQDKELKSWIEDFENLDKSLRIADKEMALFNQQLEEELNPEYIFTEELHEAHNYVILYFDNAIDWQTATEKLGIGTRHTSDSKPGYTRAGTGRVLRGDEILDRVN